MAVQKKVKTEENEVKDIQETPIVDNGIEEKLKEKELENKAMQEQIEAMKKQQEELNKMIMQMQSNQNAVMANTISNSVKTVDEKVKIQSYLFGRNILTNEVGNSIVDFQDSEDTVTISSRVLDGVMTSTNKKLFRDGLVSFIGESEKYYDEYGIVKPLLLSKENILEILKLPKEEMLAKLDKITDSKTNDVVIASVFWNMIRLFAQDIVPDRNVQYIIGEYFNCPRIQDKVEMCHYAKNAKFIK